MMHLLVKTESGNSKATAFMTCRSEPITYPWLKYNAVVFVGNGESVLRLTFQEISHTGEVSFPTRLCNSRNSILNLNFLSFIQPDILREDIIRN